jgi:hypothetical protein
LRCCLDEIPHQLNGKVGPNWTTMWEIDAKMGGGREKGRERERGRIKEK